MKKPEPKIGKKGATARIAEKYGRIRGQPLSKKVFEIVEENFENNLNRDPKKKSAKPARDLDL
jgi:hypothetical protein